MSENWKYQASPRIGDMLSNVRGDTAEEFEANLANFPFAAVAQFQANLAGAGALGQIVQPHQQEPTQPIVHPSGQQQAAQPPAWAQQQPSNVVPINQPQQGGNSKLCPNCGNAAPWSKTQRGGMFKCPNYKGVKVNGQWADGGNGHLMEFTN